MAVIRDGSEKNCDFDARVLESPCRVLQLTYEDMQAASKGVSPADVTLAGDEGGSWKNKHAVTRNPMSALGHGTSGQSPVVTPTARGIDDFPPKQATTYTPTTPELKVDFTSSFAGSSKN